jgi:small-conductance mechanosensitive channel
VAAPRTDDPGFLDLWTRWLVEERTVWLLLALIVTVAVARRIPAATRPRLRLQVTLVAANLGAMSIAAATAASGYAADQYLIAAFAFEMFAFIAIGSALAFRIALPRIGLALPRILIDIFSGVAVIVALIAIGTRAGFSVTGLITTSAVLTAVIGFALQDTLGNMMGGIALQLDRSINVGDWIVLTPGQQPGRVTEIRWRYTAIETQSWTTIIVPNSMLMKSQVTVIGRRQNEWPRWRRDVDFYVEFQTPPGEVTEVIRQYLSANPVARMADDPPVMVLFHGVSDGRAWYKVRYWLVDLGVDEPTDAEVRMRVFYALRRAGMSFSIPAQAVLLTTQDAALEQRRADRELERRLAAIDKVDLLSILGADERKRLAAALRFAPFARGEAMTREGDVDDGLYMIVEGEAAVKIGRGSAAVEVARLGAGKFFGEMSLMTGEKRSATVVAATDCTTYRLDKPAFQELVQSRPEIADAVAELLAERRMRLEAARDDAAADVSQSRKRQTTKQDILGRIRGFFNLGSGA